jgi:hypothetical protein
LIVTTGTGGCGSIGCLYMPHNGFIDCDLPHG